VLFYFSKSLATNTSSSAGSAVPISLFLIGFLGLICERQTSDIHRFFCTIYRTRVRVAMVVLGPWHGMRSVLVLNAMKLSLSARCTKKLHVWFMSV
jgi:hypothetical protein